MAWGVVDVRPSGLVETFGVVRVIKAVVQGGEIAIVLEQGRGGRRRRCSMRLASKTLCVGGGARTEQRGSPARKAAVGMSKEMVS